MSRGGTVAATQDTESLAGRYLPPSLVFAGACMEAHSNPENIAETFQEIHVEPHTIPLPDNPSTPNDGLDDAIDDQTLDDSQDLEDVKLDDPTSESEESQTSPREDILEARNNADDVKDLPTPGAVPIDHSHEANGAIESREKQDDHVLPREDDVPPTPPGKADDFKVPHPVNLSITQSEPSEYDGPSPRFSTSTLPLPTPPTHKRSLTVSRGPTGQTVSLVLISSALETIGASKEAKRSAPLRESTQKALDLLQTDQAGDHPREIFEPLRLACETKIEKLMITSLDCISKLVSYSFFAEDTDPATQTPLTPPQSPRHPPANGSQASIPQPSLVDLVAHTITSCHTETTPETVSLQIVKALLALVLSPTTLVHHSSLLKAVRTVYNVFLLSTDSVNQMVAQGGLSQIVHHIFARCRVDQQKPLTEPPTPATQDSALPSVASAQEHSPPPSIASTASETNGSHVGPLPSDASHSTASLPLDTEEHVEDVKLQVPTITRQSVESQRSEMPNSADLTHDEQPHGLEARDLFIKDAFLVFRALCKLTMKPLNTESERDLKSHAMRSKLLSLHLVLTVLNSHMPLLTDPRSIVHSSSSNEATSFVQAINQYLCLCLSRNAVSPVPQVFEISVEIFWRVLAGMRTKLKKEIEVLLHEIFLPIIEMKTSTLKQKAVVLGMLQRLCQDPQALVEIYLNYDCDSEAVDNIYEHIINIVSKIGAVTASASSQKSTDPASPALNPANKKDKKEKVAHHDSLSAAALAVPGNLDTSSMGLSEGQLKRQALECLASVLRSLVVWGTAAGRMADESIATPAKSQTGEDIPITPEPSTEKGYSQSQSELLRQSTPDITDDPSRFENAKQKKNTFLEGVKRFNFKPKRGIQFLIENGFIPSKEPADVARFLLNTDGLNKSAIGEYLGEADQQNIDTMHAFVDMLDFRELPFLDALRLFLQSFRLPGEAQKIDRFMLKFAERFIAGNSKTPFANADAAYVLAFSVIMLNTDAHSTQVKKRMSKAEFTKNNRGINDNNDLPPEFLSEIYDEIVSNEIKMKDEVEASLVLNLSQPGFANALANVGRDLQKEAYVLQSNGMATKTEALFRSLMRSQRGRSKSGDQFFGASHFVHVRPMFEIAWIPFLAGLSGPLQETDDIEVVELCLEGFKNAIHIVCFFDLELQRNAFVTTLAKFTFLNNLGEMKTKNMEAIKTLLDVAVTEGNQLKGSWHEVLTCVSQLEHMQLISAGVDVPDAKKGRGRKPPTEELANESRSTHITVAADMVFSLSHFLSGTAIVDFVQALSDVSWEEIQSSGLSQHPRLFSLQKLVEISYYNMARIRLEWSNLWDIIGEHFKAVCCHPNPHVGFFALDALRQLAMRFLEKEELPHFKFQKDFLKPFEHTMVNNQNPDIRDMVLQCLAQMIQARAQNIRSGWRTMFGVFSAASKVLTERIASSAFEIVTRINKNHFVDVVKHGAFADLTVCITEFSKASKYQKISLLSIAMLRDVIPVMLRSPECPLADNYTGPPDDGMIKFWFPVLFGFYDIIMNGEDLEVRRLALDSLFTTLKTHGSSYPVEFWDTVCQELLFPIFAVLKNSQDLSRFTTQEDMSVWLSTTMIQALRNLIDLYTFYFDVLERFLDGLMDLLCVCICQENDTLARIGTSCLQQLLEKNVTKLSPAKWERVTTTFVKLFRTTTPHQLFDESLRIEIDESLSEPAEGADYNAQSIIPAPLSPTNEQGDPRLTLSDRRRTFKQIIVKCVLQLLLIETTNDLLRNDEVYSMMPPNQLLRLMGVLDHSYQFARMFNDDKELRTALWKVGFMKHLPNLLKQESSSASTLVHVLLRMYFDPRPEHQEARPQIAERLLPLGLGVLQDYNKLRADTQSKNISAWTPVVGEILEGFSRFDDKAFTRYLSAIYPLAIELLGRDVAPEVRQALKAYLFRVGLAQGIVDSSAMTNMQ